MVYEGTYIYPCVEGKEVKVDRRELALSRSIIKYLFFASNFHKTI